MANAILKKTVVLAIRAHANPGRAEALAKYLQCHKGGYGEGDKFHGLTVPLLSTLVKKFAFLPHAEIEKLLRSPFHEERAFATMLWSERFKRADQKSQSQIFKSYMRGRAFVNNWDLIDGSAPVIVGGYLRERDRKILYRLAASRSVWDRRIAVLATLPFIRDKDFRDILKLARRLLHDEHDLMHKAVGWMLREMGKRDPKPLRKFLEVHASRMPRTMLRYSIERLAPQDRANYMGRKSAANRC